MVSRVGVSAVDITLYDRRKLGPIGWYCNWRYRGATIPGVDYYPMVCAYVGDAMPPGYADEMREYVASHQSCYPPGTTWLIGNEIGYTEQQDSRTPLQYAKDYHAMYGMLKSLG